jgi:hypothetical protein
MEYPLLFKIAPGQEITQLKIKEVSDTTGNKIILVGRFSNTIQLRWVTSKITDYSACALCCKLCFWDELKDFHSQLDYMHDEVIVCAPPLDGQLAFALADRVYRDVEKIETTCNEVIAFDTIGEFDMNTAEHLITPLIKQFYVESTNVQLTQDYDYIDEKNICLLTSLAHRIEYRQYWKLVSDLLHIIFRHPRYILLALTEEELVKIGVRLHNSQDIYCCSCSHDTPIFSKSIEILMQEEQKSNTFFFSHTEAINLMKHKQNIKMNDPKKFIEQLREYVGIYLDDLDLSKSCITGPAMAACMRPHINFKDFLNEYYPVIAGEPESWIELRSRLKKNYSKYSLKIDKIQQNGTTDVVFSCNEFPIKFKLYRASIVKMYIDVENQEEYDAIVQSHYKVILRHCPWATLQQNGSNWCIGTTDVNHYSTFRAIKIKRGKYSLVSKNYIPPLRAYYTHSGVYMTVQAFNSYIKREYFSYYDNKNITDILLNYKLRGYCYLKAVSERQAENIKQYAINSGKWALMSLSNLIDNKPSRKGFGEFPIFEFVGY